MTMLTKLKYVGVRIEDLIDIYILFIRSVVEYCSVAFHSSLTQEQASDIEQIQKTSLKVILGDSYMDYSAALEMCWLDTLYQRREKRCLNFALKCSKHPINGSLFPLNSKNDPAILRKTDKFVVNGSLSKVSNPLLSAKTK